jgi:hypothetical protein
MKRFEKKFSVVTEGCSGLGRAATVFIHGFRGNAFVPEQNGEECQLAWRSRLPVLRKDDVAMPPL